ncbi:hypothetical protein Pcac1_g14063 [Phytophthora cactorum]|nr:hypothetical protein Pcac1_g14063 [Phytophthora cactorum]
MVEIIYGKVNPSGRMPITYPKDQANIPDDKQPPPVTSMCQTQESDALLLREPVGFGHGSELHRVHLLRGASEPQRRHVFRGGRRGSVDVTKLWQRGR